MASICLYFSFIEYRFVFTFNYQFPTLRLELSIVIDGIILYFYQISIRLYLLTIDFQPCM